MKAAAALGLVVALGGCGSDDAAARADAQRAAFRKAIAPLYVRSSGCQQSLPDAFIRREIRLASRQMRLKMQMERDPVLGADAAYVSHQSGEASAPHPTDCRTPQSVFSDADIKAIADRFDGEERELDDAARAATLYKSQKGA